MKVAINLWTLKNKNKEGIGWFAYYTTKHIIKAHPEVEFHLFVSKKTEISELKASNVKVHRLFPDKRHPALYILFLHYLLPLYLKKIKPNVFLSPDGMLSVHSSVKQLPVIHDINFVHFPKDSKWYNRWYYNKHFPKYAQIASRIATVSYYSRNDIANTFKVPKNKIDVVYNGLNEHFIENTNCISPAFSIEKPYFLYIGSVNPRKNIARLILAFSEFKRGKNSDIQLVIAGAKGWLLQDVQNALDNSEFKSDIVFTGRLTDGELKFVLSNALALVFIPYFEGFGLPLIEAMSCNVPVISSNVTSLPEIAGDAALYVDPYNTTEIANAMKRIFEDPYLRKLLISSGIQQAKKFSWEQTSERLWNSIMKVTAVDGNN